MNDDLPRFERIHTKMYDRREQNKNYASHMRKSLCAKAAFTRKQGLTQANTLMKEKGVPYLRIYKCHCGCWHLTHQRERYARR